MQAKALSAEENVELLKKAKSGDLQARELFFVHNYRLIMFFVGKNKSNELSEDEVISAAQFGFLKAYNSFDLTKEIKFATYAAKCVQNEIWMLHRRNKKLRVVDSMDATIYTDDDGNELTLKDRLVSSQSEAYNALIESAAIKDVVADFCKSASLRERQIVKMRFEDGLTHVQIGKKLSISQSYISRLEKRICAKLRLIAQKHMNGVVEVVKDVKAKEPKSFVGKLKWFFENTKLNNSRISALLSISDPTVKRYRQFYDMGQMTSEADPTAAELIAEKSEQQEVTKFTFKNKDEDSIPPDEIVTPFIPKTVMIKKEEEKAEEFISKFVASPEIVQSALLGYMEQEETAKKALESVKDDRFSDGEEPVNKYTARPVNHPTTISLALEDADSYNIEDAFRYVQKQLNEDQKYKISVQIEQVK